MRTSRLILIAGAMAATCGGLEVSAMPKLDPAGKCGATNAVEAPSGNYFRTCGEIRSSADGGQTYVSAIEKFLPTGALDKSWGDSGIVVEERAGNISGPVCTVSSAQFFFPSNDRVLVRQDNKLRAFRENGIVDTSYGQSGISAPLCLDSVGYEIGLSAEMRVDGSIDIISAVSLTSMYGGGEMPFRARRILDNGLVDTSFGKHRDGVVDYAGLQYLNTVNFDELNTTRTTAWALQPDDSLQVGYFVLPSPLSPTLVVRRQPANGTDSAALPGQALPNGNMSLSFAASPNPAAFNLMTLGYGKVLVLLTRRPASQGPNTPIIEQVVFQFNQNGALDFTFGDRGAFVSVNPMTLSQLQSWGCLSYTADGIFYLQGDGSIVYRGAIFGAAASSWWSNDCAPISFTWKIDSTGKLDPAFPQWSVPRANDSNFQSTSPGWTMVEYYNANLDRYFMTPHAAEQAYIADNISYHDAGWRKTGRTFGVWDPASTMPGTASACRFAADPIVPPKTFFDSIRPEDCNYLRQLELATPPGQRAWRYDRESFRAAPPVNGICASTLRPIYGLYNLGAERGVDADFRYVSSLTDYDAMIARGWVGSKVPQFCARPDR